MKSFIPQRRDSWRLKVFLSSAPKWMRYMTYGFVGYAVINFIPFLFIASDQHRSAMEETSSWMSFYSAAFLMLYSALQIYRKGIMYKCPNGHKVPLSAEYCDKCGERIRDSNESW
jgi:hypothetical protein